MVKAVIENHMRSKSRPPCKWVATVVCEMVLLISSVAEGKHVLLRFALQRFAMTAGLSRLEKKPRSMRSVSISNAIRVSRSVSLSPA